MQRDGFERAVDIAQFVGAAVGIIAIVLAVFANRNARQAETRSRNALVRERRIDFHLGLLKDLAELNQHDDRAVGVAAKYEITASLLPVDLVPVARSVAGLESTVEADAYVTSRLQEASGSGQGIRSFLRPEIRAEIHQAIERLLAERGDGGADSHRGWWSHWGRFRPWAWIRRRTRDSGSTSTTTEDAAF